MRLQRLWEQPARGSKGSGSSQLEAPEALGAAISRLQRLWEQPCRGSRGSGSSYLEAPEALEAQVAPTSIFSSFLEYSRAWRPLGELPRRLREARGGLPAASSQIKRASRWLRVASRAFRSGLGSSGFENAQGASRTYRKPAGTKSSQLESAIYSFIHRLVLLYIIL